ncbi:putative Polycomb group protein ASXL2 isoform X2 [Ranitomeya variabilis]|uniref:putative Polycomb group protein ASXL2 isoform X2 n=1 Tax=Ranitomeya variabilis TaxID=490064 RepID=UPI00405777CE
MRDAARRKRRRRRRKKKGRTWAEAARTVLEKYHNTPMSHKEILQVIQREGLKEISGTSPLACLNAMLHTNSRGEEGMFYKVPGRMGVYTLKRDVSDAVPDLSDCSSDSSDAPSDSQSSESSGSSSSTSATSKERRRSCWKSKVTSRFSQPSSPQSSCPSPPIPAGKVISPSQKLSKKALKQALMQQQQKKRQQRRPGIAVPSTPHLVLKSVKTVSSIAPAKPAAAHKQLRRTRGAEIDVETPESILVNTNLRALINKHTFSLLPGDGQQRLLRLLPEVDRLAGPDGLQRLNSSALNNEFFTSASQSWKERLSEGEFTPEMQMRIRQEIEKEKKMESWKEQFYERYYGENSGLTEEDLSKMTSENNEIEDNTPPPITHIKVDPAEDSSHGPVVEEQRPAKPEDLQDNTEIPEVTEAIREPEIKNVDITDLTAPQDGNIDVKAETEASTEAPSTCESKNEEPRSQQPTSPAAAKSPGTTMTSNDSPPEESPEKTTTIHTGVKRRLEVGENSPAAPEKSPRMMEPLQSQQSFRALCKPPAETQRPAPEPKVPPLKIPVAWLSSKPFLSSQVSPRPTFLTTGTSPGRTGARTLADIKAKARLARAQRAAAVAAHGCSIPGPGPGGGPRGEIRNRVLDLGNTGSGGSERGTASSIPDNQNQREVQKPVQAPADSPARAQLLQKPSVQPEFTATPHQLKATETTRSVAESTKSYRSISNLMLTQEPPMPDKCMRVSAAVKTMTGGGTLTTGRAASLEGTGVSSMQSTMRTHNEEAGQHNLASQPFSAKNMAPIQPLSFINSRTPSTSHGIDKIPSTQAHNPSVKPLRLGVGQLGKLSSSIPANNPLVTKLLQGKNVPLEQIMPRPLTKVEVTSAERPQGVIKGLESCGTEEAERPSNAAAQQLERFLCHNRQHPTGQRIWQLFSGKDLTSSGSNQMQGPEEGATSQEQVLQTLIKKVWQENANPAEFSTTSSFSQRENISQRFMLGFLGRRTSKPAMSGHYLLNISTYGRVSEVCRQAPSDSTVNTSVTDPEHVGNRETKVEPITHHGEDQAEPDDCSSPLVTSKARASPNTEPQVMTNNEFLPTFDVKETVQILTKGNIYNESDIARDLIQAAQAKMANVLGVKLKHNAGDMFGIHASPTSSHPELLQSSRTCGNSAGLLGSGYGGTINISTSPEGLSRSSIPTGGDFSPANTDNVVSFSVTVTTIPSSQSVSSGCEQPISVQTYTDDSSMEMSPSKCYCRLKAMIMCKGCGAFCHDDCIGPSKLCVSCLVVR